MPTGRAWAAVDAKSRWARGVDPIEPITFAWYSGGMRHNGFCGMVVDFRGVQPVRELNGQPMSDQRVRWKPAPPTYDVADVMAAKAARANEELRQRIQRAENERFWSAMHEAPKPPPSFRNGGRAEPGPRRDFTDAFAWVFKQTRGFNPAMTDSSTSEQEHYKNVLRRAIAELPPRNAERERLERLLQKIEREGG